MSDDRIPPKIPPIIGPQRQSGAAVPPVVRPVVAPKKKNPWLSGSIWLVLGIVLIVRFTMFPMPWEVQNRQQQRFRRPPMVVNPPRAEVPADLWRVRIEIEKRDADKLRRYFWHGPGSDEDREDVFVTVKEGKDTYTDVAMHLKGSAGSFRPFDDKPAMTLNFSKKNKDQKFHGLSKISLNNSAQDPSYLSEAISRELFIGAGVPATKSGHATVLINDRDLGLYVWTEGFGKGFLKRYFKNVKGNLYDGGFAQEIHTGLKVNSGDKPDDHSDLQGLLKAAAEPDRNRRWERLNEVLDMPRFISFVAMEVMTCHWDGYSMNHNNTRIFHDLDTDKIIFIPHGMDQMFGTFRSSPSSSIFPQMNGRIAQAVVGDARGRKMYEERITELMKTVFVEETIVQRVEELSKTIEPTLAAYDPRLAEEHASNRDRLIKRIQARSRSITQQLIAPQEVTFNGQGSFSLTNWAPRVTEQARGRVAFQKAKIADLNCLTIRIRNGESSGSFRTRVNLPEGSYRFHGRVRLKQEVNNAFVALRVSGDRKPPIPIQVTDWVDLDYPIRVTEDLKVMELICEFRGREGEAIFDQSSLQLVRD